MSHSKVLPKKKQTKKQEISRDIRQFLADVLNVLVSIYMLLIMVVLPFYFTDGYSRIGTNKYEFFYGTSTALGVVAVPVCCIYLLVSAYVYFVKEKHACRLELLKDFSLTDWFALGYAAVVILSYLCSDYREMTTYGSALKGANGWYMGLVSQLIFVAIYFMISRFWKKYKWMLAVWLPVTLVVFVLGYLNRFEVRPIEMKNPNTEFISTIGNINWYCGYMVTLFFAVLYYIWSDVEKKRWIRNAMFVWLTIGFATLLTQGSRSGVLALGGVLLTLYLLSMKSGEKLKDLGKCLLCMGIACAVTYCLRSLFEEVYNYHDTFSDLFTFSPFAIVLLVFTLLFFVGIWFLQKKNKVPVRVFTVLGYVGCGAIAVIAAGFLILGIKNTLQPGSIGALSENPLFTFNLSWGSRRGATWAAGIMCFRDQDLLGKLVGVGPDSMVMYVHSGADTELTAMVKEYFGNQNLTNAHCEWLTMLVNVGLVGLISYAGMMVSAIVRFIKAGRYSVIAGACGFGVLAYTLNNMVSFQQTMGAVTVFLVLGIGEAYLRNK